MNHGFVYIMTNYNKSTFYVGVTNNLFRRVKEHKQKVALGFTKKYNCSYLVYYEYFDKITSAIEWEKKVKDWHRDWRVRLIKKNNPEMVDLTNELH